MASHDRGVRRRLLAAALFGVGWVLLAGAPVALPALAVVALVYLVPRLLAVVLRGEPELAHPDLALVIVANALAVLAVQLLLALQGAA
ncbi:hypothetical protein HRbin12_00884 [bacterium HR12]|nr:hypothetical protein HRbin12_00884 [bacterium HR12]